MGRRPCCLKEGLNRGAWTAMEDEILTQYIAVHGEGKWRDLPQRAGLRRCGKSCRLRWLNYLRPTIKRGNITPEEDDLIIRLHNLLGNRWALIAGRLPGRTDNEIKNYWNTKITKTIRLAQSASTTSTATTTPNPLPPYISDDQPQHVLVHSSSDDDDDQYNTKTKPSVVVRTKATRCTKAVVIPSLPPQLQDHVVIDPPAKKSSLKNSVGPERLSSPLMILEDDDDISNFLIDFEMDELFLSDFVNNDFMSSIALQPSCLDLSACAGTGISTSTSSTVISTTTASTSTIDDASPKSDHETLLFPEEEDAQLLHCSDMQQTMASLIDSDDLVGSIKT